MACSFTFIYAWVLPLIPIVLLNFSRIAWGSPVDLIFQAHLLALLLRCGLLASTLCSYTHCTLLRCWDAIRSHMENCWWNFSFFTSIHIWIIFGNNQITAMKAWTLLFPWWTIQFNSLGCINHLDQKGKIKKEKYLNHLSIHKHFLFILTLIIIHFVAIKHEVIRLF